MPASFRVFPAGRAVLLALGLALLPGRLAAQFYQGDENKIQYRRLEWQVLKGPRVDVYYYPAEAELAPVALAYAEETYDVLAVKFGHTVTSRVPLIIYASHSDFEQTNILPFTPPEGLLGVTDFLKRRVTLPFRGNLAEFRHTLRHEMVHVFQISLLYDRYLRSPRSAQIPLPLWFTEGLAEYWSAGEDARDEMIMRDLVLSGRLPRLQELEYVTGGIVYPLGGRIHRWLAETYGDWRVATLYHELWRYDSFAQAMEATYGRSVARLNEEFQVAMRRAYYPVVNSRASLAASAQLIARAAIKPVYSANDTTGGDVVYASAAKGFVTLTRQPVDGGNSEAIVTAGRSASFENFHAFDSRVDASRPGVLLLSTKFQERDALVVYDRGRRRVVGRYQFPELVSILSPVWGPDGRSVIFSGLAENGLSDLYRVSLREGTLEKLTDDRYQDLDPSISPDGGRVVFASDRTAGGLDDAVNLFIMDLQTRAMRQITYGAWVDETPRWVAPDTILFSSGRDGVLNAFSVDTLGRGRRETSAWTGAFDAAPVPGRDAFLVGGFQDLSLSVYLYPGDSLARQETFELTEPPPHSQWSWPAGETGDVLASRSQPYARKYTLDFAAGEFVYAPRIGTGQGATFLVSDLLNDHLFYFNLTTFQGRQFKSVFENISVLGLYLNQTRRLNWGVGAFRFKGNQYAGDFEVAYTENTAGVFGLLRYPLSRFARVEGQASFQHSNRFDFTLPVDQPRREGWIASQSVSYVHDNSLWVSSGPIDGHHLTVTTGIGSDFSNARFDSYTAVLDGRQYLRLGRRSAVALRALGFYSGGDRPERVNIGGTLGLRGYPNYGYILGSRAWMLNSELRFPLLDYFTLGTPVGAVRFPEFQGAFFVDAGRTWFSSDEHRALLGSFGVSFRWPLVAGLVLRLDWGRRFSDNGYQGYGLTAEQRRRSFVQFFFGYNY
jgi:WD40-like Beta Propeller Repeat